MLLSRAQTTDTALCNLLQHSIPSPQYNTLPPFLLAPGSLCPPLHQQQQQPAAAAATVLFSQPQPDLSAAIKRMTRDANKAAAAAVLLEEPTTPTETELEQMEVDEVMSRTTVEKVSNKNSSAAAVQSSL
jgi:hypothetical protein